jgi:hypothetical protein
LLISEQTFEKQACIPRNTILIEQRTYPFLDLTERRRPQRRRLFNRRCRRPRSSNHGLRPATRAGRETREMLALLSVFIFLFMYSAVNTIAASEYDRSN